MNSEVANVPVRTVLVSIAGLWLAYFLLITARGAVVGLEMQDALLWRRFLVCVAGAGVTVLLWLCIRLFMRHTLAVKRWVAVVGSRGEHDWHESEQERAMAAGLERRPAPPGSAC